MAYPSFYHIYHPRFVNETDLEEFSMSNFKNCICFLTKLMDVYTFLIIGECSTYSSVLVLKETCYFSKLILQRTFVVDFF